MLRPISGHSCSHLSAGCLILVAIKVHIQGEHVTLFSACLRASRNVPLLSIKKNCIRQSDYKRICDVNCYYTLKRDAKHVVTDDNCIIYLYKN